VTQPTPTHTHVWDGGDLPDWLQLDDYHFDNNQLVIYTPDSPTRPQPGWWLIRWTDNTITVASPTVAERVYGPDGLAGQLTRIQAATDGELRRQLDAAICALGRSETELARLRADIAICRAQQWPQRLGKAEKRLARVQRLLDSGPIGTCCNHLLRAALDTPPAEDARPTRHVHVTITNRDEYTANRAALSLADWITAEFPGHHVTTDAREWPAEVTRDLDNPPDSRPFIPAARWTHSEGYGMCIHTIQVGPDSCPACRDLASLNDPKGH
jgi:hypothetical protein